jgi:hypothetical protein
VDHVYENYHLLNQWNQSGFYFICPGSDDLNVLNFWKIPKTIIVDDPLIGLPLKAKIEYSILGDQEILNPYKLGIKDYSGSLRLVMYATEYLASSGQPRYEKYILTNNFSFSAESIVKIYLNRIQIDRFYRTITYSLNLSSFLSDSSNAIHIQIYVSIITYLLLKLIMAKK